MIVLVCGSRTWTDGGAIRRALEGLRTPISTTTIIHGGARGADDIAGYMANELGFTVVVYPAEWKRYGKKAGPIRNQEMLDKESPDGVLAFQVGDSRGTQDMINRAKKAGVPCQIHWRPRA